MLLAICGVVPALPRWLLITLVLLIPLEGRAVPGRRSAGNQAALARGQALLPRLPLGKLRSLPRATAAIRLRQSRPRRAHFERSAQLRRQLTRPLQRSSQFFSQQEVGELSTASLLLASASKTFRLGAAGARFAGPLSGVGSLGLGLHSLWRLTHATTYDKKIEALHGLAWSLQGMRGLGYLVHEQGAWIEPASQAFGVTGGALQTFLGVRRLVQGWRQGDRPSLILGSLDLGAGLCWAASSLSWANPYTLGGFIGFTLAQMAYYRRDTLKQVGVSCGRKVTCSLSKARRRWRARGEQSGQATLQATPSPYADLSHQLAD